MKWLTIWNEITDYMKWLTVWNNYTADFWEAYMPSPRTTSATHCNTPATHHHTTLQHTIQLTFWQAYMPVWKFSKVRLLLDWPIWNDYTADFWEEYASTKRNLCNTLQHDCNTLQHDCNTRLQHTICNEYTAHGDKGMGASRIGWLRLVGSLQL